MKTTVYKRRLVISLILVGMVVCGQSLWAQRPKIQFKVESFDLGILQEGEKVSRIFEFMNAGDAPLKIFDTFGDWGCTAAVVSSTTILPGKTGILKATFDTSSKGGENLKNIYVVSNDPLNPQKSVQLKAKIENFHRAAGSNFVPEKIFTNGCASCHAGRAKGKSGVELFESVCGVCHRTGGISSVVDAAYAAKVKPTELQQKISIGVKKMPGFSADHGGPLTIKQIESLVNHIKALALASPDQKAAPGH
jgi:cytochrome c5